MSDAKPSVKLSRRFLLRHAALGAGLAVVGASVFSQRASAAKMSQKAAAYQDKPKADQRCDKCTLFQPASACKVVDGDISPEGWCKLFVLKAPG